MLSTKFNRKAIEVSVQAECPIDGQLTTSHIKRKKKHAWGLEMKWNYKSSMHWLLSIVCMNDVQSVAVTVV